MNFDFSDELKLLRDQARKFLAERSPPKAVRRVLEGEAPYDKALWQGIAEMGWLGIAVPEEFGGAALGYEGLCVLAEELGHALAPVPLSSSVYLATEAVLAAGNARQKSAWLPKLVEGSAIGCFALAEGAGNPSAKQIKATVKGGKLTGSKLPVADGGIADFAVVAAKGDGGRIGLYLVDLEGPGVKRETVKTVDPSRDHARLGFEGAAADLLDGGEPGWELPKRLLDRAAILIAFEQVGGAQACLDMAKNYALERYAFGRQIGSFQAIKHKLADVYIATELARSNAYYGAWAIATGAAEMPLAAAAARVSAIEAYHLASKENIQTHGGMGFTWEFDCHLYYRRAKLLALAIGSAPYWKDRLVAELETRNAV
ncbi:MAG TPA: acyl-CoA dehydrogenase family protein [Candidatus Sulfotelmatobacter sp.]|nr:acyl-CoA dehydrogenase family protein [Candidatus Sulfotelmatobacter sp.]